MQVYVPSTVAEALELRSSHDPAYFLGGGTLINGSRWRAQGSLVSLQALGLEGIEVEADRCLLGAMCTWGDVARSEALGEDWAVLRRACKDLGRINVRNQATVGGAVAASQTFSDLLPALWILDAEVKVQGAPSGAPVFLSLADWAATAPKDRGLILGVSCPRPATDDRFGRARLSRNAGDIATMKVLCRLRVADGAIVEARVAMAVAGLPVRRLASLEEALVGRKTGEVLEGVKPEVTRIAAEAKPVGDVRGSRPFKQKIMAVLLMDAIRDALGEGGEVR